MKWNETNLWKGNIYLDKGQKYEKNAQKEIQMRLLPSTNREFWKQLHQSARDLKLKPTEYIAESYTFLIVSCAQLERLAHWFLRPISFQYHIVIAFFNCNYRPIEFSVDTSFCPRRLVSGMCIMNIAQFVKIRLPMDCWHYNQLNPRD